MEGLSEVLQNFLKSCEESSADRYTETDVEYNKHCEGTKIEVPIEERWFVRPPRSHQHYDRSDRDRGDRGDRDRGDRGDRDRGNRGDRGRWEQRGGYNRDRDHRRDRDNYGRQRRGNYNDRNHPYSRPY